MFSVLVSVLIWVRENPSGQRQNRTADPLFFRQVLYRLSYLALLAGTTGFEPATSCVTGRRKLQTLPRPQSFSIHYIYLIQQININAWVGWESNPRP